MTPGKPARADKRLAAAFCVPEKTRKCPDAVDSRTKNSHLDLHRATLIHLWGKKSIGVYSPPQKKMHEVICPMISFWKCLNSQNNTKNCHCILHLRHMDEAWTGYSQHPAEDGQWGGLEEEKGLALALMHVCVYVFTGRNCAHICSFWVVGKWVFVI